MTNLKLESVCCDLCGKTAETLVTHSTDHEHGISGVYNVVRCNHCGLHYLNPRPSPESISQCYPGHYYAYSGITGSKEPPRIKQRIKTAVRASPLLSAVIKHIGPWRHAAVDAELAGDIPQWIKPGKVLDVGCGSGAFLDSLRDNGWTTFGIEPSEAAAALARAKGHTVFCQSVTESLGRELAENLFDVVMMSHSLEHVHSPTRALENLRPLLKPVTGHLIIEVPNVESVLTYLFGELSLAFDTPRHLYMYSPDTLTKLLEKAGFEVQSMRHIARPVQFVRCLRLLSETATAKDWRPFAEKFLEDKKLPLALKPLAQLAEESHMGGAIRVVATRK